MATFALTGEMDNDCVDRRLSFQAKEWRTAKGIRGKTSSRELLRHGDSGSVVLTISRYELGLNTTPIDPHAPVPSRSRLFMA
jgi:hypothetical protein